MNLDHWLDLCAFVATKLPDDAEVRGIEPPWVNRHVAS
jgi:hypothetical protein